MVFICVCSHAFQETLFKEGRVAWPSLRCVPSLRDCGGGGGAGEGGGQVGSSLSIPREGQGVSVCGGAGTGIRGSGSDVFVALVQD